MLLGLGDKGSSLTTAMYDALVRKNLPTAPLISCFTLDGAGRLTRHGAQEEPSLLFECSGLRPELAPGVFRENADILKRNERQVTQILGDGISNLRRQAVMSDLVDQGWQIDDGSTIYLLAALCDPVGSAVLVPVMGMVQSLLAGRLRGTLLKLDALGFFPDLFDDYRTSDFAYARTYATIQELEYAADHPEAICGSERHPFDQVFFFTRKNEDSVEIGSVDELMVVVSELISLLLERKVASDVVALVNKVEDKAARFSSMGMAKLVLPTSEMMNALGDAVGADLLESRLPATAEVFDRGSVAASVKQFVVTQRLDRLSEDMRLDETGKTIWVDFAYEGSVHERANVEIFLSEIERQAGEFGRTKLPDMARRLAARRDQLLRGAVDGLQDTVSRSIDGGVDRGVYYSAAFLDVLADRSSVHTRGDSIEESYGLSRVEAESKRFFDQAFGIDRERPLNLKRELDAKKELLARYTKDLARAQETAARSETAGDSRESAGVSIKRTRVSALQAEIADLEPEYLRLTAEVAAFDLKIEDPSERRRLLEGLRADEDERRESVTTAAHDTDTRYRDAERRCEELREERRRLLMQHCMVYPIMGAVLLAAVFVALRSLLPAIPALAMVRFAVGLTLVYGAWAFLNYWTGIRARLGAAESEAERLGQQKVSALLAVQEFYSSVAKRIYEHTLNGGLISLVMDLRDAVTLLAGQVESFVEALRAIAAEKRERFARLAFQHNVLIRNVANKADVEHLLSSTPRLEPERARFFKHRPLSVDFNEFRTSGAVNGLLTAIDELVEDVFAPVRQQSIEQFLADQAHRAPLPPGKRLVNLWAAAKAFILLDIEKGQDRSAEFLYLGVANVESSLARDLLRTPGAGTITAYGSGTPSEIVMAKLKIGFPAFQVASVKYAKASLAALGDSTGFYATDWSLKDLFPSVYTLGDEADEARRLACLGRAFSVIGTDGQWFSYAGRILGASVEDLVANLRAADNAPLRQELWQVIEDRKHRAAAVEELERFRRTQELDRVDEAIVNRTLNEINPLA